MKQLIVSILIVLSCTIFVYAWGTKEEDASQTMMESPDTSEGAMTMMADDSMSNIGGKVSFTDLDAAQTIAAKGPAVLFFYADWCPTCQIAMKNIDENSKKLGDITVIVVNYDKARDLREKYLVTYQHTFVQIDENGGKLAIWNGGGVDSILKNTVRQGEN
jgi:thioredoxin 1